MATRPEVVALRAALRLGVATFVGFEYPPGADERDQPGPPLALVWRAADVLVRVEPHEMSAFGRWQDVGNEAIRQIQIERAKHGTDEVIMYEHRPGEWKAKRKAWAVLPCK